MIKMIEAQQIHSTGPQLHTDKIVNDLGKGLCL